ncbi:MAG: hypothetical protein R3A52_16010 [Polyangiales bacterium]
MRFAAAQGSFDAPDHWLTHEGVGVTDAPPDLDGGAIRRSVVVILDAADPQRSPEQWCALQRNLLEGSLVGLAWIDDGTVERSGSTTRATFCYQLDPPGDPPVIQWLTAIFHGAWVAIITTTAPDADPGEAEDAHALAVTTYAFPDG